MGNGELNTPNSLDDCTDGLTGTYETDESIESITVRSLLGQLQVGATVVIETKVHAYGNGSEDYADFYYAADASNRNPNWVLIGTAQPNGGGMQTVSTQFILPAGDFQAVRVNFRWGGSGEKKLATCGGHNYDDVDDLAFAVAPTNTPEQIAVGSEMPKPRPMKPLPKREFSCDSLERDRCTAASSCRWKGNKNEWGTKGGCQPRRNSTNNRTPNFN